PRESCGILRIGRGSYWPSTDLLPTGRKGASMLDNTFEKARELGRLLGQTEEYRALQRARQRIGEDREANELIQRLSVLEVQITQALQRGETPSEALQAEYEQVFDELQASPAYQQFVAGQANFDRL